MADKGGGFGLTVPKDTFTKLVNYYQDTGKLLAAGVTDQRINLLAALAKAAQAAAVATKDPDLVDFLEKVLAIRRSQTLVESGGGDGKTPAQLMGEIETELNNLANLYA
jgi:hypothetical protein